MVKISNIAYAKLDLKKVGINVSRLYSEEITMVLNLLEDFGDLFDGTLGLGCIFQRNYGVILYIPVLSCCNHRIYVSQFQQKT